MSKYILTGSTGVLGSYIVKELVEQGHHVNALVRSKNPEHLKQRINDICDFYQITEDQKKLISAFDGDIYKPQLGLSKKDVPKVFDEAQYFIHSAASLNLNQDKDSALKNANTSTTELLQLCKKYGFNKSLKKLDAISTVGVGGKTILSVNEDFINSPREFHNNYELAKSSSEKIYYNEIKSGLPITLHRPSMIVGDSIEGKIYSFQVFYFILRFLSGNMSLGILPTIGRKKLDIINVDYVAQAILTATRDLETSGRVLHQCSGHQAPFIKDIAASYKNTADTLGLKTTPIHEVPTVLISLLLNIATVMAPKSYKSKLKPVPHFLEYLNTPQFFENKNSYPYFQERGLVPADSKTLLLKIINYFLNNSKKKMINTEL